MSKELLQGLGSVKTNGTSCIIEGGHLLFTGYIWPTVTESYIPISDCTHTFIYTYTYESIAGNYFYIGIERYDKDKATGSNSCCIYQVATNNTAKSKQTISGTVNLNQTISSSNTNKTAFVRLRILNNWSGSSASNATAKIYQLSLREIMGGEKISISRTGITTASSFWENYSKTSFGKYGDVDSSSFYEY